MRLPHLGSEAHSLRACLCGFPFHLPVCALPCSQSIILIEDQDPTRGPPPKPYAVSESVSFHRAFPLETAWVWLWLLLAASLLQCAGPGPPTFWVVPQGHGGVDCREGSAHRPPSPEPHYRLERALADPQGLMPHYCVLCYPDSVPFSQGYGDSHMPGPVPEERACPKSKGYALLLGRLVPLSPSHVRLCSLSL